MYNLIFHRKYNWIAWIIIWEPEKRKYKFPNKFTFGPDLESAIDMKTLHKFSIKICYSFIEEVGSET